MKRYLLAIVILAIMSIPTAAQQQPESKADAPSFKLSGLFEGQIQKDMWGDSVTRVPATFSAIGSYPEAAEDFWMRVSLKGEYRLKNLEGVFNLRFYPYWTMRRQLNDSIMQTPDLGSFLDLLELNQAYIKIFKDYSPENDLTFQPFFKIGRDGMQNSCSDLFGNYLDRPAGGYGQGSSGSAVAIIPVGPFLNKQVFANQIEAGFSFNVYNMVGGKTSVMIGGNVSNAEYYSYLSVNQLLDSKLSAGFYRIYQDLYFFNNRIHIGGGIRNYTTSVDTGSSFVCAKRNFFSAQGTFDAVILPDLKFYTEMAMQKIPVVPNSFIEHQTVLRPINAGLTIPTFGVVDTLAVEFENVASTFFSDHSMRDSVGVRNISTKALAWGMVVQKKFGNRINFAWGLYTGDQYGDMATVLRLSTYF